MAAISPASSSRIRRTPLDFAGIFAGLLLIVILLSALFWQFWHSERIFTGVSVDGVALGGLTRAAAVNRLSRQLDMVLPPVQLTYDAESRPLPAGTLRAQTNPLDAANQAYLVGRQGGFSQRAREQLVAALGGLDLAPARQFDAGALRYGVEEIARTVRTPARPAVQAGDVLIPARPGIDVDVDATVQDLMNRLTSYYSGMPLNVPLAVVSSPPPNETVNLAENPTAILPATAPLLLRDDRYGLSMALDGDTLDRIVYTRQPLRIDRDALNAVLDEWAVQLAVAPRNARLRFDPVGGGISILQASRPGRALDVAATAAAVEEAVTAGQEQTQLVMNDVAPAVDSSRIGEMGIRELVASGVSYFAGSSADRIRNIEVAAEKMAGVVIPPDAIFSFNQYVEDVSAANGFEDSLIIWGDRTAVGVGGGVCQVSTTLFRAAYQAGLPIVERYNHGYVVDWYGEPGFDATIFTPTVDFRFRNDTANYLLVQPVVDSANGVIAFNLYGTKPDRQVLIGAPVITDEQDPPEPAYQVDESLARDERRQVEWAKAGMTVNVERTVIQDGESRTDTLTSVYQPWRAVYLVGPGTPVPATPTPEAEQS
ncbi:MAG: VanW family protein [Caldilineaceae bacterium]|nr:VanW family protein [Caldilineaceae bacterium]